MVDADADMGLQSGRPGASGVYCGARGQAGGRDAGLGPEAPIEQPDPNLRPGSSGPS